MSAHSAESRSWSGSPPPATHETRCLAVWRRARDVHSRVALVAETTVLNREGLPHEAVRVVAACYPAVLQGKAIRCVLHTLADTVVGQVFLKDGRARAGARWRRWVVAVVETPSVLKGHHRAPCSRPHSRIAQRRRRHRERAGGGRQYSEEGENRHSGHYTAGGSAPQMPVRRCLV
eukprot:COSAG02_NODE_107_length_36312_cov_45.037942_37_plen_176_part_00